MIKLVILHEGSVIIKQLTIKSTFLGRFSGHALNLKPDSDTAMLFLNTRRVHTLGMLFSLDIHYFDCSMKFLGSNRNVRPNKIPVSPKGTRHILEVPVLNSEGPIHFKEGVQVSLVFEVRF